MWIIFVLNVLDHLQMESLGFSAAFGRIDGKIFKNWIFQFNVLEKTILSTVTVYVKAKVINYILLFGNPKAII